MNNPLIMIVDDEAQIRRLLKSILEKDYRIMEAKDLAEAKTLIPSHKPALLLLDINLPDGNGLDFLPQLKSWYHKPVIIISVHEQPEIVARSLDQGADDYIQKPFDSLELLARVRLCLRRDAHGNHPDNIIVINELSIDLDARVVKIQNQEVRFTSTEYDLLVYLAKNVGKVLTGPSIVKEVWGTNFETNNRNLRVYIRFLRSKLSEAGAKTNFIQTEQGIGYRFLGH